MFLTGLIISPQNEEIILKLYNLIEEKPLHFYPYPEEVPWNAQEFHFFQHYFDSMMYDDDDNDYNECCIFDLVCPFFRPFI